MRTSRGIIAGVIACILAAAGAYFWASSLMDSLYAYRSPLRADPPAPGVSLGQPQVRRVVFVLIDALRLDTSLNRQVMPVLDHLRSQGAYATMHSRPPSYSEPGYSVLLTGAWPDLSDGPAINLDYPKIWTFTQDNLFSAAHRAGLKTAVSAYYWFERLIPQEDVDAHFYTPGEDRRADRQVVDAALPWLRSGDFQLVLIHIDQVDYAGHHEGGPRSPNWDAAASRADALLGEILATLDLSQDVVFVCSDHGQIDRGGHGGNEPVVLREPFVLAGAHVKAGNYGDVNMADVAPTLAALLGANLPASAQGQALTEMLDLPAAYVHSVQEAETVQQRNLIEDYGAAIGRPVDIPADATSVAAFQQALEAARDARLNAERLPRAALALGIILLMIGILIWRRSRLLVWMLSGAVVFQLIFHLRYDLLDRLTYSLSWVPDANTMIVYMATTSLIALFAGWLVFVLGSRVLRSGARAAAEATLGFALVTIVLLSLPVLFSYAWNGALITWTLPEFTSSYLGLLGLIQGLAAAVGGILLAGVAGLIGVVLKTS